MAQDLTHRWGRCKCMPQPTAMLGINAHKPSLHWPEAKHVVTQTA